MIIMKFLALSLLFVVVSAKHTLFNFELSEHWDNFKTAFGKKYEGHEESARRSIFEQKVTEVVRHNLQADMGLHKFRKGINQFSDMSQGEFIKHFNGLKLNALPKKINGSTFVGNIHAVLPDEVDWRKEGYVTPVKNQLLCTACWAFSATGSLEGQHMKKTGKLVALSAQNLIDCSQAQGNEGCENGLMDLAFEYIKENKGIDTEESYPYTAKDGDRCLFKKSDIGATCTGYVDIPTGDEEALKKAVALVGPISVLVDAGHDSFISYQSGVYDEPDCSSEELDHAVLVVGYGTEDGNDYWLVKNSWGTTWGMKGYIKMSRNNNNQCGIASLASYPLV